MLHTHMCRKIHGSGGLGVGRSEMVSDGGGGAVWNVARVLIRSGFLMQYTLCFITRTLKRVVHALASHYARVRCYQVYAH